MHINLSIIIPAYNCASTIERCIDSLLSQETDGLQIIVINDGSVDNTLDVLKKYADIIKVISINNQGPSNARNAGLSMASGEFVMFLDSDDAIASGCLSKAFNIQKKYDADIVRFGYKIINENGRVYLPDDRFLAEECIEKTDFPERVYENYISGIRLNSVCATVFKRTLLQGIQFRTDMPTAEDAVFSLKAYTRANRVAFLPEPYYLYYQTSTGITGSSLSVFKKYKCNFILSKEIIRHLPEWGMDTLAYRLKALIRPIKLTFDKLKRIRQYNKNFKSNG